MKNITELKSEAGASVMSTGELRETFSERLVEGGSLSLILLYSCT